MSLDLSKYTPEYIASIRAVNPDFADEMEALVAENRKLSNPATNGLKVSEKGGFSLYGLQRFPITLHAEQWKKVFAMRETIEAFIKANENDPRVVAARLAHAAKKGTK